VRGNNLTVISFLQAAAYIVIVALGIRTASHILVLLLISALLAYAIVPLPRWLRQRFNLRKNTAVRGALVLMGISYLVISLLLVETGVRMEERLPAYAVRVTAISERADVFLNAHGIQVASLSPTKWLTAEKVMGFAGVILPEAAGFLSDRLLVWLLSLLFLMEIAEHEESKGGPFAALLNHYGDDVEGYIAIMAKTGAITALANFVLLVAVGVDFPILWCVLYFFLHFIPNLGILLSMLPPAFLALIMFGWKRALFVVGGFLITDAVADYVLQPKFMNKGLDFSFLEMMLSLVIWAFLLGPWGGVLAIPLTLVLKKFIAEFSTQGTLVRTTPG
jgi:predicted PurR-regulated permease PerM